MPMNRKIMPTNQSDSKPAAAADTIEYDFGKHVMNAQCLDFKGA